MTPPVNETLSEAICAECGNAFTPVRSTAKFCSAACRVKANRRADAQPDDGGAA
jgi:hypothetical protein